jgi:endonuclease YncB( thermonuclease family)
MRAALISLVILLAAGIGLVYFMPDPSEVERVTAAPAVSDSFVWSGTDEQAFEAAESVTTRGVAPELFAQPFAAATDELERVEPRAPLTTQPVEDTGPQGTPLFMPNVIASGLIRYGQGELQLDGIEVVEPERICTDPDGNAWPCGVIARMAFRNFLRGRALTCTVPGGQWQQKVVTECRIGNEDPAAWLAGNGWAPAVSGTLYADLARTARDESRGIYGRDPREEMPDIDSRVRVTLQPVPQPEPSQ